MLRKFSKCKFNDIIVKVFLKFNFEFITSYDRCATILTRLQKKSWISRNLGFFLKLT